MTRLATGLALLLLAVTPAAAGAQATLVAPGDAAVDQYVEVVPTAGGDAPTGRGQPAARSGATGATGSGASAGATPTAGTAADPASAPSPAPLSRAERRALTARGADGAALAAAAATPALLSAQRAAEGISDAQAQAAASADESPLSAAGRIFGGAGTGLLLPGFLLVSLLAAVGVVVTRRAG